jgi:hypothetical protein
MMARMGGCTGRQEGGEKEKKENVKWPSLGQDIDKKAVALDVDEKWKRRVLSRVDIDETRNETSAVAHGRG